MPDYMIVNGELYHHGVKGMKWGVRRYQKPDGSLTAAGKKRYLDSKDDLARAKTKYKIASREYSNSYNYAYGRSTAAYSPSRSKRIANDERWNDVRNKANQLKTTKTDYKQAKKTYKQAKADYKELKTIDKFNKHGLDYNFDTAVNVHTYGWKGAKRIEDRIANKNMSRLKSEMIETGRQTAMASLATIGTFAVIGAASKAANPKYQVLDSAGKVLRNFY